MLGLMFNVSCTSKNDTDSDQETAEATDPALDVEGADAAASTDSSTEESSIDDFAEDEVVADTGDGSTEQLPDEALAPEATGAEGEEVLLSDDGATSTTDTVAGVETSDGSISDDTSYTDSSTESSSDASMDMPTETPTETPTDVAAMDSAVSTDASADYSEPKPKISVKKIKDTPFNQGGMLLNTVYLARQGDDMVRISNKIYGSDKSAELLNANPYLKNGVKVGDKIYYNSPRRSQDAERMLTFYEDNGVPAQSYVAKSGDNIRKISKTLLGDSGSWKEVWATNLAVESKGDLPEGTELRYWTDSGSAMPVAEMPQAADMMEPVPEVAQNNVPAPAPAQDDFAMPDDMSNGMAAGTVAAEPPPPPPPPAPQASKQVASADKDMTFMLSAGGLLLVGVGIMLAVMRRSRSRKISINTNTQI